ncbi:MAG TPA: hypothetical protein VF549_13165 [Solirubrobacteraceae bacterium]|jgi:hypothetical protein
MAPTEVALQITTQSQVIQTPSQTMNPPKITLNGTAIAQPKGSFCSGFQVVVIDPTLDITSPASIRSNNFLFLYNDNGNWMTYYSGMYNAMKRQILTSGNTSQQIVLIASFGMDVNAAPTPEALELLLDLGAGPQLQQWLTTVDIGSQSGDWVGFPGNYVLVGQPQYGFGEGTEAFQRASNSPVSTTVDATLTNFGS